MISDKMDEKCPKCGELMWDGLLHHVVGGERCVRTVNAVMAERAQKAEAEVAALQKRWDERSVAFTQMQCKVERLRTALKPFADTYDA
jgi:hypothetical protein